MKRLFSANSLAKGVRACLGLLLVPGLVLIATNPGAADQRSTFPGRRIGGGTRGECSARFLAHLVPTSSVFAPGPERIVAILVGKGSLDSKIVNVFSSYPSAADGEAATIITPKARAGLYVYRVPARLGSVKWESHYECSGDSKAESQESDNLSMNFIAHHSPPAISLLVKDGTDNDKKLQKMLLQYASKCNQAIPSPELLSAFNFESENLSEQLPNPLPVYCE